MNTELMFSSALDSWATPYDFFKTLNEKYQFVMDICAAHETAKCSIYYTKEDNCLDKKWPAGYVFMNPPYGREIGKFIKKAYQESLTGTTTVCLLPARTDTKWFHDYCTKGQIDFIKGRLIFGTEEYWEWVWEQPTINGKVNSLYKKHGRKNSAPFPSMVVVFKGKEA